MPIRIVDIAGLPKKRPELAPTDHLGCDMVDVGYAVKHLTDQGFPEPNVYVCRATWPLGAAEEIGGRTMQIYAGAGEISRAGTYNTVTHEYGHSVEKEFFDSDSFCRYRLLRAPNTDGELPHHVLIQISGWSEAFAEDFAYLFGPPEVWTIPYKFRYQIGAFGFGPDGGSGFEAAHQAIRELILAQVGLKRRQPAPQPDPSPEVPEPNKPGASVFADITGHWAEADILECAKAGVLRGDPDGRFRPDGNVTRAELAAVVARLLSRA